VVGIILLVFAFALREILVAYITSPIAAWIISAQATLGGEWIFRGAIALVGFLLILVAIGINKVHAAIKWISDQRHAKDRRIEELEEQNRRFRERLQEAEAASRPLTEAEELKKDCRELAVELKRFVHEFRSYDPAHELRQELNSAKTGEEKEWLNTGIREAVDMHYDYMEFLYKGKFRDRAANRMEAAADRGWVPSIEVEMAYWAGNNLAAIDHVADTLNDIGHRP
jgi:hypothetical protein